MLQQAGLADEVVAAGYLHDMLEDCGYTRDQLAEEVGNERVADLV
jgi:(p)ppGpp synthase/HD superfamily hydrolase